MTGPVTKCFSLIRGRVLRVTKTDGCGAIIPGYASSVVSDGFITVTLTAQTDTGTAISVTNAAGKICISDTPCPKFTGYSVDVAFCGVNPALLHLMTGQPMIFDDDGEIVGFKMNTEVDACDSGFALELWSSVPTGVCEVGVPVQYGYFLLPFLKGGVLGDFTVGNDAVNFTMTGAMTKDGSAWGVGPYDVVLDTNDAPSPLLEGVEAGDHLLIQLTGLVPPTEDCDVVPVGTKATGATDAGAWTPPGNYAAWDLADMGGVSASPGTAWAGSKYVVTESGQKVDWTGAAWEEWTAP